VKWAKRWLRLILPVAVVVLAAALPMCHREVASKEAAMSETAKIDPLVRTVDLKVGESQKVVLCDGAKATVKLVALADTRDSLRGAVRRAEATVEVNGKQATLVAAMYHLPVALGGVQVDCAVTKAYLSNSRGNPWGLVKDARLRLWPAGSPWIRPGTFVYPTNQRWFATQTQMANEPTFVDGVENPAGKSIYYHNGLDIGGSEGLVDVLAAADGLIISAGEDRLDGYERTPSRPRYDTVTLLDGRGWFHRHSHLKTVDVKAGQRVRMGEKIGALGKEGDAGGWSHLHYGITARQPSGRWGTLAGYAFLWQAYQAEHEPKLIAVARPHAFIWTGQSVTLDGSKSRAAPGKIARWDWTFTDGSTAGGATVKRSYPKAGQYSEILKVTDDRGNVDYDFATVQVIDREHPKRLPPGIHACYWPTFGIKPGDPVTFTVRTFGTTHGEEVWNFGDGTAGVRTKSDGNVEHHARDGYAVTRHRFAKAGHYLVTVRRSDAHGQEAIAHLAVRVGQSD